jgi:hypothetical protein
MRWLDGASRHLGAPAGVSAIEMAGDAITDAEVSPRLGMTPCAWRFLQNSRLERIPGFYRIRVRFLPQNSEFSVRPQLRWPCYSFH